jgi:hypothetical protein
VNRYFYEVLVSSVLVLVSASIKEAGDLFEQFDGWSDSSASQPHSGRRLRQQFVHFYTEDITQKGLVTTVGTLSDWIILQLRKKATNCLQINLTNKH